MSKYRIRMDGKVYEMEIELIEKRSPTTFERRSQSVSVKSPVRTRSRVASVKPKSNIVVSPMPGSVVKILHKVGDEVSVNQSVLILEAMKMENEISAPKTGKIKAIHVIEGQAVNADSPLFEMEE